ncbi:hypothetical protein C8F04DRAFT_1188099 [Mycena alexandri]|uniref:Uncharacterized protein n=1 Tax=Mycena alexandri TaxID=1745969 RepID=A0AAD6SKK4_9AGAR|nr:hypothetical protein C8F04DRAFT_1188099 [Mycena alexandri]
MSTASPMPLSVTSSLNPCRSRIPTAYERKSARARCQIQTLVARAEVAPTVAEKEMCLLYADDGCRIHKAADTVFLGRQRISKRIEIAWSEVNPNTNMRFTEFPSTARRLNLPVAPGACTSRGIIPPTPNHLRVCGGAGGEQTFTAFAESLNGMADLRQKWGGGAFRARPLMELGLWVNLGHAGGECAASIAASDHAMTPDRLFQTNFNVCGCPSAPTMEAQLWEYLGWVKAPNLNKKRKKLAQTAKSVFKGSSADNPWQLGDDGQLFLLAVTLLGRDRPALSLLVLCLEAPRAGPSRPSTSGRAPHTTSIREAREVVQERRIIFGGPPSMIRRFPSAPPAQAGPVASSCVPLRLPRRHGYAPPTTWKLTTEDLYIGTARPPVLVRRMLDQPVPAGADPEEAVDPKPHHKCAICCSPKSHPVS